jgi:holliday junction DNA helicase RuvA
VIARLKGTLIDKSPNRLVVDVGGVGYDVLVPLSTFYTLGEAGSGVTLRIHTHVREDVIALYGFGTGLEQDLFERLIGVSGIGPKLALAVLSGIDSGELVRAIRTQDVARLTRIPGIGKKTAERIGLELKDRLAHVLQPAAATTAEGASGDERRDDLLSALTNLGYQRQAAEKAIDATLKRSPDASFEELLRDVLRGMMGQ